MLTDIFLVGTLCKGLVCLGFALCRPCATQKSALGLFGVSVPPKPQQAHGDDGDDGDDDDIDNDGDKDDEGNPKQNN